MTFHLLMITSIEENM